MAQTTTEIKKAARTEQSTEEEDVLMRKAEDALAEEDIQDPIVEEVIEDALSTAPKTSEDTDTADSESEGDPLVQAAAKLKDALEEDQESLQR